MGNMCFPAKGKRMKQETFVTDDYRPAEDEPFMNERQLEYFRRKLLHWKAELLAGSRDTIEGLQDGTRNIPDVADRADFYDDILRNYNGYQDKFKQDLADMNAFALRQGLPPVVAMVLNQSPSDSHKSRTLVAAAEQHMAKAGMTVIPADNYYRKYQGEDWRVSEWEGHPNQIAHQVFAREFAALIRTLPAIRPWRKSPDF